MECVVEEEVTLHFISDVKLLEEEVFDFDLPLSPDTRCI